MLRYPKDSFIFAIKPNLVQISFLIKTIMKGETNITLFVFAHYPSLFVLLPHLFQKYKEAEKQPKDRENRKEGRETRCLNNLNQVSSCTMS